MAYQHSIATVTFFGLIALACGASMVDRAEDYSLSARTHDQDGGCSSGGAFDLQGTIGEPIVVQTISAEGFSLEGTACPGVPKEQGCVADFDGDGVAGLSDLVQLLAAWGTCAKGEGCPEDLNGSRDVDLGDLIVLLSQWGECEDSLRTARRTEKRSDPALTPARVFEVSK